jgi:hypothetical protein
MTESDLSEFLSVDPEEKEKVDAIPSLSMALMP